MYDNKTFYPARHSCDARFISARNCASSTTVSKFFLALAWMLFVQRR